MERDKALHILKTLADGIDPASGEQFADDSPYQRPNTVRALCWAIQMLEHAASAQPQAASAQPMVQPKPEKSAKPRAEGTRGNAGRPWTPEEEAQLSQAFDSGRTLDELAQAHQRSRWAIEARLAKLGKIPEPPAGLRFPIRPPAAAQSRAAYSPR
jgi:hypothetical protein